MKIFYLVDDDIHQNCLNYCPILNKENDKFGRMVGSIACRSCKHCYGAKSELTNSLFGQENGELKLNRAMYIKCSAVYREVPLKIKIKRFFYQLKKKI